jgi:hypothetical protein
MYINFTHTLYIPSKVLMLVTTKRYNPDALTAVRCKMLSVTAAIWLHLTHLMYPEDNIHDNDAHLLMFYLPNSTCEFTIPS